eukprot:5735232-Amphidinium_carterae.2
MATSQAPMSDKSVLLLQLEQQPHEDRQLDKEILLSPTWPSPHCEKHHSDKKLCNNIVKHTALMQWPLGINTTPFSM